MKRNNATAMKLAWGFFKGNYALNFAAIAVLIVLNLLGMVPVIGILFVFAYSILSFSVQIYFGKSIDLINEIDEIRTIAANTRIGDLFTKYLHVAAGGFVGLLFLAVFFAFVFGLIFSVSGGFETMNEAMMQNGMVTQSQMEQMMLSFSIPGLVMLFILGLFFYFLPAVIGRVIKEDDFVAAFKDVFLLFSPTLWKSIFNKEYFMLILIWSFVMIAAVFIALVLMMSVVLLPLLLVFAYLLSLYNAAIYRFAADLAK